MMSLNSSLTCICQNHEKFETETHLYFNMWKIQLRHYNQLIIFLALFTERQH